jgi:uncharacterized protein (DUF433 family)
MATPVSYPHIEAPGGQPARLQRVPRVRVAQIVADYLAYGWSAEEMCRQHPYLKPAEVHAALAYYYDHADEIDAEVRAEAEQAERDRQAAPRSPLFHRLRAQGRI